MKKVSSILFVLVGISLIISELSTAQPIIPREQIPADTPANVKKQIERLYSPKAKERIAGAQELGKLGEKAIPAIPFLIGILGDNTGYYASLYTRSIRSVKSTAAEALGKIGAPAVHALIAAVKDKKDVDARNNAIRALGVIKDPLAVETLIDVLTHDEDSTIRINTAQSLGAIKDPRAVEPLMDAMIEEKQNVRRAAAAALTQLNDPRLVELMIAALQHDKDIIVRLWAARTLAAIKDLALLSR